MNMTHTEKPSDNYSRLVAPQVVEKKNDFQQASSWRGGHDTFLAGT